MGVSYKGVDSLVIVVCSAPGWNEKFTLTGSGSGVGNLFRIIVFWGNVFSNCPRVCILFKETSSGVEIFCSRLGSGVSALNIGKLSTEIKLEGSNIRRISMSFKSFKSKSNGSSVNKSSQLSLEGAGQTGNS